MTSFWLFSLKKTKKNKRCFNIKYGACGYFSTRIKLLNHYLNLHTVVHDCCAGFSELVHAVSNGTRRNYRHCLFFEAMD